MKTPSPKTRKVKVVRKMRIVRGWVTSVHLKEDHNLIFFFKDKPGVRQKYSPAVLKYEIPLPSRKKK